jgi:hypothetical protein
VSTYETFTTVDSGGQIHLAGVPFQPGTPVEVVVSSKQSKQPPTNIADGLRTLFAALDQGHNEESVGRLHREELYDRPGLH